MPSSSSLLRTRALAKVSRLAAQTQTYVAPRLESAAGAAAGKLASLRDAYAARDERSALEGGGGGGDRRSAWDAPVEPRVLTTPKRALDKTRRIGGDIAELPAFAAAVHAGAGIGAGAGLMPSAPPSPSESRTSRWGGLGSYFSTYAPSVASSAGGGGTSSAKGKGKALAFEEVDEDKVVCFPGVSPLSSIWVTRLAELTGLGW